MRSSKPLGGSLAIHREVVREAIFDSFAHLLCTRGYDTFTIADVASAAGLSRTAMYTYFSHKDALVIGYAQHLATKLSTSMRQALDGVRLATGSEPDPVRELCTYARHQAQFCNEHRVPPGQLRQLMLSAVAFAGVREQLMTLEQMLHAILEDGRRHGVMTIESVTSVLPLVMACIDRGCAGRASADHQTDPRVTEAFLLRALGVEQAPGA